MTDRQRRRRGCFSAAALLQIVAIGAHASDASTAVIDCPTRDAGDDSYYSQLSHDPIVYAGKAWGLRSLGLSRQLLSASSTMEPIVVAVLDSGVDTSHEDFVGRTGPLVTGDTPTCAGSEGHCWHGTAIAGIIASRSGNDVGTTGVSAAVRIRSYRITDDHGMPSEPRLIAALKDALAHGVRIINLSASWSEPSAPLRAALLLAKPGATTPQGALVVVTSPGYLTHSDAQYPGVYADEDEFDFLVAVAGFGMRRLLPSATVGNACKSPLDSQVKWDSKHPDNGYAPRMLAAAGETICTTMPGNRYGQALGDSFAAPYVAGMAALAWIQPQYRQFNASRMRTLLFDGGCDAPQYLKNLAGGAGIQCVASIRFVAKSNCPVFESR